MSQKKSDTVKAFLAAVRQRDTKFAKGGKAPVLSPVRQHQDRHPTKSK